MKQFMLLALLLCFACVVGCTSPQAHTQVHTRHILIEVPRNSDSQVWAAKLKEAERVRNLLLDGAEFEKTALQYSDCPSKHRGGDLGVAQRGQFVESFEEAAFSQPVMTIGSVVKTDFGYHIIQVLDRDRLE